MDPNDNANQENNFPTEVNAQNASEQKGPGDPNAQKTESGNPEVPRTGGSERRRRRSNVDKSPERVQKMFGEIAPKYDFLNNLLSVGLAKRWRRRFVKRVFRSIGLGKRIDRIETLDVATGTGDVLLEEYRQWKRCSKAIRERADFTAVGVDFVPEMLEIAKEKALKKDCGGVSFIEADGLNLPFHSDRFDAVTIAFGLRNMADPKRGIAEMARVCLPGGLVAILDFEPPRFPIFASLFRFYFHKILPAVGQKIAKNSQDAYNYLPKSVDDFADPERIIRYMRQFGLVHVRRRTMTFGVLALYTGYKRVDVRR